jgi:hypothetical protein
MGYWVENPGDEAADVNPLYGFDEEAATQRRQDGRPLDEGTGEQEGNEDS